MRLKPLIALMVACLVASFAGVVYGQSADLSLPAGVDGAFLYKAFTQHEWALGSAVILYGLAVLIKQGWLGPWLQAKIPQRALPVIAPATSLVLLTTGEIIGGKAWPSAVFDGLLAGFLPVIGHEVVIESARNGKEIVPPRGGGDNPTAAARRLSSRPPAPPATPSAPPPTKRRVAIGVFAFVPGWLLLALVLACTPGERQAVKGVVDFILSGSQLACVEASTLTSSADVAKACQVDLETAPGLQSFLDSLLAQKAAARRAGFEWHAPAPGVDGGGALYYLPVRSRETTRYALFGEP